MSTKRQLLVSEILEPFSSWDSLVFFEPRASENSREEETRWSRDETGCTDHESMISCNLEQPTKPPRHCRKSTTLANRVPPEPFPNCPLAETPYGWEGGVLAAPAAPPVAAQVRTSAPGPDTTLFGPCAEGQARRSSMSGGSAATGGSTPSILSSSQPPRQAGGLGRLPPPSPQQEFSSYCPSISPASVPLLLSPAATDQGKVTWMQGLFRRKQGALRRGKAP